MCFEGLLEQGQELLREGGRSTQPVQARNQPELAADMTLAQHNMAPDHPQIALFAGHEAV